MIFRKKFKPSAHFETPTSINREQVRELCNNLGFGDANDLIEFYSSFGGGYLDEDCELLYISDPDDDGINCFYGFEEDCSLAEVNEEMREESATLSEVFIFAGMDTFSHVFLTKGGEVRMAYREDMYSETFDSELLAKSFSKFISKLKIQAYED